MILLTGATGVVGTALLRRLIAANAGLVRCLVRDPKRLGPERVRVQIALGDLSQPGSFRNAMRGVKTVIHLGASIRDQEHASIEELNGVATMRLVRAAERAGVERFVFFSAMNAALHSRSRFFRSKALAERAVAESGLRATIFAPSIIYTPGDPWLSLLERMSYLPAMPISGGGGSLYQPIWADDVAECVMAALTLAGTGERGDDGTPRQFELAGPETISYDGIVRVALRSFGRRRPLLHLPTPVVSRGLRLLERVVGDSALATWDEAELMEIPMTTPRGTADAEALGVVPLRMSAVLGAG